MSKFYAPSRLSERISETPQGFLLCQDVPIARTGQQEYLAREIGLDELPPGTVVVVDRLEADVFAPEVLASFEGATVTLSHPTVQITVDNRVAYDKGHIQNIRRGEGDQSHLIIGDMVIKDGPTIVQIKSGLREVSCGYDCQYVQDDAGHWRQTDIRGNHVAIVPRGRAGPECSIKDSIMSKLADKVRSIWARATDEAAAAVLEGEAAAAAVIAPVAAASGSALRGLVVDAVTHKVTIAADADMAGIVAELMERLSYMERCKAETDGTIETLKAAIDKLTEAPPAVADAAPTAPKPVTDQNVIARAEILAPGIAMVEGVELAALTAAYATVDGKRVIDLVNGGKAPTVDSAPMVFAAASELLKMSRSAALSLPATPAPVRDAIAHINAQSAKIHPLA